MAPQAARLDTPDGDIRCWVSLGLAQSLPLVGVNVRATLCPSTSEEESQGAGVVSEPTTIQELSDFALPYGVTQDLYWSAAIPQVGGFSFRIHSACARSPGSHGNPRGNLRLLQDYCAADLARRGVAAARTRGN